jgi:Uma2 family endonuclease
MFTITDDDGNESMVEEPSPDYTYTYADYLKWQFEERLELFKGKIFKMSAPNTIHQKIAGKLFLRLGVFLEKQKCQVFIAPFDIRLPARNRKKDNEITTVVQPDLCIVCDETKIDERGCCGAPDVMIEILSPGNSKKEVRLKFELYEEAGVKEYWIINPVEENLIIYILDNERKFGGGKMYAGGDIIHCTAIPDLHVEVTDIFKN